MFRFLFAFSFITSALGSGAGFTTTTTSATTACYIDKLVNPQVNATTKWYYGCDNWVYNTQQFPDVENFLDVPVRRFCIDKCVENTTLDVTTLNTTIYNVSTSLGKALLWQIKYCPGVMAQPYMWWTGRPKDGAHLHELSAPASSYVPDQTIVITITTKVARKNFRGLVLYAQNSSNNKVGQWDLPSEPMTRPFGLFKGTTAAPAETTPGNPNGYHLCPKTVMHATADAKPYITKYFLKIPKGSGTVTIRAMVKDGPPNPATWGDFWILKDLVLTESADATQSTWGIAMDGESCDEYCSRTFFANPANVNKTVQDANFCTATGPTTKAEFNDFKATTTCNPVDMHSCSLNFAGMKGGLCYYHPVLSVCNADQKRCVASQCCGKQANYSAFCKCGAAVKPACSSGVCADVPNPDPSGGGSQDGGNLNSASKASAMVPLLLSLMGTKDPKVFILASFLVMATHVRADNWVEGVRGRAPGPANVAPTFPQFNKMQVHYQVVPGQEFQVEWASAHGSFTYFALLKASDEKKLAGLTTMKLDTYLKNCPLDINAPHTQGGFMRHPTLKTEMDKLNYSMGANLAVQVAKIGYLQKYKRISHNFKYDNPTSDGFAMGTIPANFFNLSNGGGPVSPDHPDWLGHRLSRLRPNIGDCGDMRFCFTNKCNMTTSNVSSTECMRDRTFSKEEIVNGVMKNVSYTAAYQLRFTEQYRTADARCSYINPNISGVLAAHKFEHPQIVGNMDQARMIIGLPGNALDAGRYILWYYWAGNMDNFDIDVINPTAPKVAAAGAGAALVPDPKNASFMISPNPYGLPMTPTVTTYDRLDHCIFEDPERLASSCIQVLPGDKDASQCREACNQMSFSYGNAKSNMSNYCRGYMMVPMNPAGLAFPESTPIPYNFRGSPNNFCDKNYFQGLSPNSQVCYLINDFSNNDFGGQVPFTLFTDTRDIGFYSTCFMRKPAATFPFEVTVLSDVPDTYRFNDKCIPCEDRKLSAQYPDWKVTDRCYDCDMEPASTMRNTSNVFTKWNWVNIQGNVAFSNASVVSKPLYPRGSFIATESECKYLTGNDVECTPLVYYKPAAMAISRNWPAKAITDANTTYYTSLSNCRCLTKAAWNNTVPAGTDEVKVAFLASNKTKMETGGNIFLVNAL